jgi:required for meiotic nuclear division protein 1
VRIPFKAWYFRSTVDEKAIRAKFSEFTFESEDPLVIRLSDALRVMVTSFGAVVFWPFDEAAARMVAERIRATLDDPYMVEEVEDRLVLETGRSELRFLHNEAWLPGDASPIHLRIVAMLLAQSVAHEYLEREADAALRELAPYLAGLRERGRIRISARNVLKSIGFAMHTRQMVLTNLALFDKPAETWDSESIMDLYRGLKDFFDLPEREEVQSAKLDILREHTSMLFQVLSTRKSHYLEWIVIILIAAEIVGFGLYEALVP